MAFGMFLNFEHVATYGAGKWIPSCVDTFINVQVISYITQISMCNVHCILMSQHTKISTTSQNPLNNEWMLLLLDYRKAMVVSCQCSLFPVNHPTLKVILTTPSRVVSCTTAFSCFIGEILWFIICVLRKTQRKYHIVRKTQGNNSSHKNLHLTFF